MLGTVLRFQIQPIAAASSGIVSASIQVIRSGVRFLSFIA
jgi:hypothetical protein